MYIIIDAFGGAESATIVTDQDGNNLVFETLAEAEKEAEDIQEPIIININ